MANFQGIFPALLTPFRPDGSIHEQALAQLMERCLRQGVQGFYVSGSTGEAFLMETGERMRLLALCKEIAANRCTLIAHVGCISTQATIALGREAQRLGYDAISAVAPFYYKFTLEEIAAFYTQVMDAVDLPMLVYNIPGYSGEQVGAKRLIQMLADERVLGLKHSSPDYFELTQIKAACPDKIAYNGCDETFLQGLCAGADGGIGSTYNFLADRYLRIRSAFLAGDLAAARQEQLVCSSIVEKLMRVGVMAGQKEILCQLGLDFGTCRAPFQPLGNEQKAFIAKEILPLLQA